MEIVGLKGIYTDKKCGTELYYANDEDFDGKEIEILNKEQEKMISTIKHIQIELRNLRNK